MYYNNDFFTHCFISPNFCILALLRINKMYYDDSFLVVLSKHFLVYVCYIVIHIGQLGFYIHKKKTKKTVVPREKRDELTAERLYYG